MTAATRTPSQRGRANRTKGAQAERDLCRWLRGNGFPGAERAVRTGFNAGGRYGADPGDLTGTPGIVWSVKDCAVERLDQWLDELETMRDAENARLGLLVHKRRGHADPARWWCWAPFDQWLSLRDANTPPDGPWGCPARLELGHAVTLLRTVGYGDPIEAAA